MNWLKKIFSSGMNKKSISILLGAGFSAPMGYPIGGQLNKMILECDGSEFGFGTDGVLCQTIEGKKPDFGFKTSYEIDFDFCRYLIQHFNQQKEYFDYEEFYDYFITKEAENDPTLNKNYNPKDFHAEKSLGQMLHAVKNIYTQMIAHFLVDKDQNSWYDNVGFIGGSTYNGYTGILNYFRHILTKYQVNVHTLNHDLFLESLCNSTWINGYSDGFEELGSPYFGKLSINNRNYRVRLEKYTGKYDEPFRLFKLHGSKDYTLFYESGNPTPATLTPDKYLKTRYGVDLGELLKERMDDKGVLSYDRCWINYYTDFLTGTSSKIGRYQEPLLFKILFEHFKNNLESADRLLIIGYGAKDSEINKLLTTHFKYKERPCFMIDPFPNTNVKALAETLNAKLIVKQMEAISLADLDEVHTDNKNITGL